MKWQQVTRAAMWKGKKAAAGGRKRRAGVESIQSIDPPSEQAAAATRCVYMRGAQSYLHLLHPSSLSLRCVPRQNAPQQTSRKLMC